MAEPLNYLRQRSRQDWLVGYDSHEFAFLVEQLCQKLSCGHKGQRPKILLVQRDPIQFLVGFLAATATGCPVFLGNPDWAKQEWQQVFDLVQPDLVWQQGCYSLEPQASGRGSKAQPGWILIPTGGSSGQVDFAIHTWETLVASVQGFRQYFQVGEINSCCLLPLYHVSGLMQVLRSLTSGGRLALLPSRSLESWTAKVNPERFFLSLVPTQLQRLLRNAEVRAWLSRFPTILLGGAPAWPQLLDTARHYGLRLALTYGMTETASQIATLKPEAFLRGDSSCGQVLPHASVRICSPTGEVLGPDQTGMVTIQASSLALGYYPAAWDKQTLQADDLGFFDAQGNLNVVGRRSDKIISGGENVFPAEVEAAIRSTNLVADVCVVGLPDQDWGQVVTAIYVPEESTSSLILQATLKDKLSKFKQPKCWIPVQTLPRNAQGKINRKQLLAIARRWRHQPNGVAMQS